MQVCGVEVGRGGGAKGSHENLIGDNNSNPIVRGGNLHRLICLETSILVPYFEYISVQSRPKLDRQ